MNIIWKGVNSTTKSGLIITSLPPISKPAMRIEETTIEGRDGSIIEELGYEAYDKVVGIGLAGNYTIDDVISYFNGAGTLLMSNEPDKYYNARIISQVDYNKLLRFKTADVTFRVQPYKYKSNENEVTIVTSGTVTNQGNVQSKPIITLQGSGTVYFRLNNSNIFSYTFPSGENTVIVDCVQEDAYVMSGTRKLLRNRNMNGEFPKLAVGNNTVAFSGTITSLKVQPKSRWI